MATKRTSPLPITVAIRISSAKLQYSFGKPLSRVERGPYSEYASLECSGNIEPCLAMKAGPISITVLGSRDIERELQAAGSRREPPLAVGELWYRKGYNTCLITVPFSVLWFLAAEIRDGRLPFLILRGPKRRGGQMAVHSIAFDTEESLEDHGLERAPNVSGPVYGTPSQPSGEQAIQQLIDDLTF